MTLTDPDCPHSVRDQINGGVKQEAREPEEPTSRAIFDEITRILNAQKKHNGDAEDLISYAREVTGTRIALASAQAERKQLEARVKVLEAALTNVRREVEKLHTGYAKMDRSDLRFLMLILDAALQERRP